MIFLKKYILITSLILVACSPVRKNSNESMDIITLKPDTLSLDDDYSEDLSDASLTIREQCNIYLLQKSDQKCLNTEIILSNIKISASEESSFAFDLEENLELILKLSGKKGETPYVNDERNWDSSNSFWITGMEVSVGGDDLIVPISAFSDLSFPEQIQFGKSLNTPQSEFFLRFITSQKQSSSQFTFVSYKCYETQDVRYGLERRLEWTPSMLGDSYQKTSFKVPNCN